MRCPQRRRASKARRRSSVQRSRAPPPRGSPPELAAMKFPAKIVAKLEALAEADQDTVLNYVNSGMKINDAYQRTIAGKPEQQQAEPEAGMPTAEAANPEPDSKG